MKRKVSARRTGRPASLEAEANRYASIRALAGCPRFSFNSEKNIRIFLTASRASLQASPKPYSLADWIRLIREARWRGAGDTLELARLMSRARRNLPYGKWSRMWQSDMLPFSKHKGEMLVVIGQGVGELDAQHSAHLPSAWNTLYYVARLGQKTVQELIEHGRIHPGLSLREAQALLTEYQPQTRCNNSHSKLRDRLARFVPFVRGERQNWKWEEQNFVGRQLTTLAQAIQLSEKEADIYEPDKRQWNGRPLAALVNPACFVPQTSSARPISLSKL